MSKKCIDKLECLYKAEESLSICQAVVKDIQAGMTERGACHKHHVNLSAFRRFIFRTSATITEVPVEENQELDHILLEPAAKLYMDVFKVPRSQSHRVPPDVQEPMLYLMEKMLNPQQKIVIQSLYFDGMTMAEAGEKLHLSRERVRQIRLRALQMLNTDGAEIMCAMGVQQYEAFVAEKRAATERQLHQENNQIFVKLSDALAKAVANTDLDAAHAAYMEAVQTISQNGGIRIYGDEPVVSADDQPIQILRLPDCLENMLTNHDIYTIGELRQLTASEMLSWRYTGPSALNKLMAALQPYGLSISGLEDETGLDCSIRVLNLPARMQSALLRRGICTVRQLQQISVHEMYSWKNVGAKSIRDTLKILENYRQQCANSKVTA